MAELTAYVTAALLVDYLGVALAPLLVVQSAALLDVSKVAQKVP